MKTIEVLVEDVTTVLNISMKSKDNVLDELLITSKKAKQKKKPKKLTFGNRNLDTRRVGYSIGYVDGEKLNKSAISIGRALQGKISGFQLIVDDFGNEYAKLRNTGSLNIVRYALWDVDGVVYKYAPPLDLENIKEVAVLKSLAGVNKYGSEAIGGVILINTKSAYFNNVVKDVNSKENPYTNKEYYNEDAVDINHIETGKPDYYLFFDAAKTVDKAYLKYKEIYSEYKTRSNFHFNVTKYFINTYNNQDYSLKVLSDLEIYANKNPEILKALAYKYQELNSHNKAIDIYKKLMRIRPKHAQSFRDLANAYTHIKQYKNAWKIYRYYLQKGNELEENSIGEIFKTEMNTIYLQRKQEAKIIEKLVLENKDSIIANDVRMVFEWNTSEAEFLFEFVNPNKQSYKVNHTLADNSEQILDEKLKGYNSKEFLINKVNKGDWLINITYFGNKKYDPTFLKVTTYYNWGKTNQKEEIKVHQLALKDVKTKLMTINVDKLYN